MRRKQGQETGSGNDFSFGMARWGTPGRGTRPTGDVVSGARRRPGALTGRLQTLSGKPSFKPPWITPQVENRSDHDLSFIQRVKHAVREHPAQQAMIILMNHSVDPGEQSKRLDVGSQARGEVIAEALILGLIESKTVGEIFQGFLGNPNPPHERPSSPFTASQS